MMTENLPSSASKDAAFGMSLSNGRLLLLRAKARPTSSGKVSSVKNGGLQRMASKDVFADEKSASLKSQRMHSTRLLKGLSAMFSLACRTASGSMSMPSRVPLCSHQGNESCSCADIEDSFAPDRAPSPEQNTICTNFHGTAVVADAELLKAENVVGHYLVEKFISAANLQYLIVCAQDVWLFFCTFAPALYRLSVK